MLQPQNIDMNGTIETKGHKLCLSCGLCCMGAFHNRAYIANSIDKQLTKDFGGEQFKQNEKLWFRLPCPVFDEKCTVYSERPSTCEKHQCDLLKGLLKNNITLEKAHNLVTKMKPLFLELTRQLDELLGIEETKQIEPRFYHFFKQYKNDISQLEFRKKHKKLLTNYAVFLFMKKNYFYLDNQNKKT